MKTNTLKYTVVKSFREKGITYKVITTIKLHDECKNGTCSWSITGILQQKKGNGRFYDIGHGCIHEEILKASPKLKMFVDLHLCDWRGTPLYPVETGYYFGNNVVFNYYSYHDKVTEEEYNNMLKNIDYSLLPEGIKFEFK